MPSNQPQLSALQQLQAYGGYASMFSTFGGMALLNKLASPGMTQLQHVRHLFTANGLSTANLPTNTGLQSLTSILGKSLAVAGVLMGSISTFQGIQSMFQNGFSGMGLLNLGTSAIGIVSGVNILLGHAALMGLAGPVGWMVMGGVVAFSVIWSLFHKPPEEVQAAMALNEKLTPVIWSAGPMAVVGLGTAAILMGWPNTSGTQPVMSQITIPAYFLTDTLRKTSGFGNLSLDPKSPTVLMEQGTDKNNPGKVIIVTPSGADSQGNAILTLNTFDLYKNLQFVSNQPNPQGCYIPFFINVNGKVQYNPAVVKGMSTQQKLLESVLSGGLNAADSVSAVQLAAAANKDCVDPNTL